jgi:signal transduction histidine kinase
MLFLPQVNAPAACPGRGGTPHCTFDPALAHRLPFREVMDRTEALTRALRLAVGSLDVEEALRGVLREALGAVDGAAGCVLEEGSALPRVVERWDAEELAELLRPAGAVGAAMARRESWVDDALLLPLGAGSLLLLPMQLRAVSVGALAIRFADDPTPEGARLAQAFADLAALALEHDRLHEDARRAHQERDHFLVAVNHEMRTPAMTLALNAHLLRAGLAGGLPPKLEKSLRKVEADVATIVRILDGLRVLGEVPAEDAPQELVHPRQVVLELLRRVEPAADRKKLRLSLYAPRTMPLLQTDLKRLSHVLLHLLSNAVKYTAEGGIEVRLEQATRVLGPHRRVPVLWIRVKDTGCGIPPTELERILDPFVQVDEGARTDSPTRGFGLGLSIARRLARSLDGELLLESTPGEGTTASLALPYRH